MRSGEARRRVSLCGLDGAMEELDAAIQAVLREIAGLAFAEGTT